MNTVHNWKRMTFVIQKKEDTMHLKNEAQKDQESKTEEECNKAVVVEISEDMQVDQGQETEGNKDQALRKDEGPELEGSINEHNNNKCFNLREQ